MVDDEEKVTPDETVQEVSGTNYVWMGLTLLIFLLTLAGSIVTYRLDKKDEVT